MTSEEREAYVERFVRSGFGTREEALEAWDPDSDQPKSANDDTESREHTNAEEETMTNEEQTTLGRQTNGAPETPKRARRPRIAPPSDAHAEPVESASLAAQHRELITKAAARRAELLHELAELEQEFGFVAEDRGQDTPEPEFEQMAGGQVRRRSSRESPPMPDRDARAVARAARQVSRRGKPKSSGRRRRQSHESLKLAASQATAVVKEHKEGLRSEQIRAQLRCDKSEMAKILKLAVAEGWLRKSGEKRSTTYFAR